MAYVKATRTPREKSDWLYGALPRASGQHVLRESVTLAHASEHHKSIAANEAEISRQ
jgi:hypothetical protein